MPETLKAGFPNSSQCAGWVGGRELGNGKGTLVEKKGVTARNGTPTEVCSEGNGDVNLPGNSIIFSSLAVLTC